MSEKNLIERWKNFKQPKITELKCLVCDLECNIENFRKYYANDIFHAGQLIRYQCPNCDVIFGDLRFLRMNAKEISDDYSDVYSFFKEGEGSIQTLNILNYLDFGKNKTYLDYACGNNDTTINLLTKNNYNIYAYDAYVEINHHRFIKNITNVKFDIVYSKNFIEHVINPYEDLQKLIDLLNDDGKLVLIAACWDYCAEFTHYHTFYFLGRSVNYLCNKLNITLLNTFKIDNTIIKIFQKNTVVNKKKSAFFLSHNGLGDNITNIGAINFLLQYYDSIYFLCKDIYEENVKLLFYNKKVITMPFDSKNELNECKKIINSINKDNFDIFISGFCHMPHFKSHITNISLLNYKKNNIYKIEYSHILDFYNNIGLDSSIYIDYFDIESNEKSLEYYDVIKNYKIVFLHTKTSQGEINLDNIINEYINKDDFLIICANKNVYKIDNNKYTIANNYVNIKIAYYIDIIKQSKFIHVVDSCFSCIIYPLIIAKKIQPEKYVIYPR
jgi:SAM-dependent methyltransferase